MPRHRSTSKRFDSLRKQKGREAAVRDALGGGATLSSGGSRLNFPGGGSRLMRIRGSELGSSKSKRRPRR